MIFYTSRGGSLLQRSHPVCLPKRQQKSAIRYMTVCPQMSYPGRHVVCLLRAAFNFILAILSFRCDLNFSIFERSWVCIPREVVCKECAYLISSYCYFLFALYGTSYCNTVYCVKNNDWCSQPIYFVEGRCIKECYTKLMMKMLSTFSSKSLDSHLETSSRLAIYRNVKCSGGWFQVRIPCLYFTSLSCMICMFRLLTQ